MNYKLLVLDLDGTLTNNKKEITPRTLETLIKVQERGVKLVLASGRPTYGIVPLAYQLKMDDFGGYILSFNGGKILEMPTLDVIYESSLPSELIAPLYKKAVDNDSIILTYKDQFILTEKSDNRYVQHEAFLTKMTLKEVDDFCGAVDFIVDKCLIVGESENLIPLVDEINGEFGEKMNAFRSEPFFLELVPKGIDKALSLQRLLDYIGGSVEEMIAVGDGFNDLSMIRFAGLGVAMANGQEQVRAAANYITLSNEEDGVAAMAEKFILGKI